MYVPAATTMVVEEDETRVFAKKMVLQGEPWVPQLPLLEPASETYRVCPAQPAARSDNTQARISMSERSRGQPGREGIIRKGGLCASEGILNCRGAGGRQKQRIWKCNIQKKLN